MTEPGGVDLGVEPIRCKRKFHLRRPKSKPRTDWIEMQFHLNVQTRVSDVVAVPADGADFDGPRIGQEEFDYCPSFHRELYPQCFRLFCENGVDRTVTKKNLLV